MHLLHPFNQQQQQIEAPTIITALISPIQAPKPPKSYKEHENTHIDRNEFEQDSASINGSSGKESHLLATRRRLVGGGSFRSVR